MNFDQHTIGYLLFEAERFDLRIDQAPLPGPVRVHRLRILAVELRIAPGGDRVGETLSQSDAGRGGGAGNPLGVRGRGFRG